MLDGSEPELKLCVNCVHCMMPQDKDLAHHLARCRQVEIPSLVDSFDYEFCKNVRRMEKVCGYAALMFEPKIKFKDE